MTIPLPVALTSTTSDLSAMLMKLKSKSRRHLDYSTTLIIRVHTSIQQLAHPLLAASYPLAKLIFPVVEVAA